MCVAGEAGAEVGVVGWLAFPQLMGARHLLQLLQSNLQIEVWEVNTIMAFNRYPYTAVKRLAYVLGST